MSENFYRAFEDRYRGSRDVIKGRLRVYLPFVEPIKSIYEHCSAVDLGCGRGEWLELLGEIGISATGVDLNSEMLRACTEVGLAVEHADAIAYLGKLPDESVCVISAFHVAEHITFSGLQALVEQSHRVLKPAGLMILETPNSENIVVGTSSFYLDPTHEKPIPPLLLSFLPEHYGFARTKILRLQEQSRLSGSEPVRLFDVLSGVSPDVAVIAQKAAGSPSDNALFDPAFGGSYGIDLEMLADRYDAGIAVMQKDLTRGMEALSDLQREFARSQERLAQFQEGQLARIGSRLEALASMQDRLGRAHEGFEAQLVGIGSHLERLAGTQSRLGQEHSTVKTQLAAIASRLEQFATALDGLRSMYDSIAQEQCERLTTIELRLDLLAQAQEKGWRSAVGSCLQAPNSLLLRTKLLLKPHFVRAGKYLRNHPRLKSALVVALKPFPGMRQRCARAAQPASNQPKMTTSGTTAEKGE